MRKKSYSVALRNEYVLKRIKEIKGDHPFWGYRRVWAYLRYIDGLIVNKKRVYRLMREHNLTVKPNHRLIAKRVSDRPKPRADKPKQWWGIDMTKVLTNTGWVYVVIVLEMKEELFGLREWESERELSRELDKWVEYYNRNYLHSALGYRSPVQVEMDYYKNNRQHSSAA